MIISHALKDKDCKAGGKQKTKLRIATWNKGGANQELHKKALDIETCLRKYDIDYLGVTEANLRKNVGGGVPPWGYYSGLAEARRGRIPVFKDDEELL